MIWWVKVWAARPFREADTGQRVQDAPRLAPSHTLPGLVDSSPPPPRTCPEIEAPMQVDTGFLLSLQFRSQISFAISRGKLGHSGMSNLVFGPLP